MNKKIKKGQEVFLSCLGHNNFFYPADKEVVILYDVEADIPCFVGGGDTRAPIIIPENSVVVSGSPDRKIIVWEAKARVSH